MYQQALRTILLILGLIAYAYAVPLVTAGSSLEARTSSATVSFLDYDRTAKITGKHGFYEPAQTFAVTKIKQFFAQPAVQHSLGFSGIPTIDFTDHYPYNTVEDDSGIHFNLIGGTKCESTCAVILGKATNSIGKDAIYSVAYNNGKKIVSRGGVDVALVVFVQPTTPTTKEEFNKQVDEAAKTTIKRFFEHPEVATALKLVTPAISFEDAYTHKTISEGGISFGLYSGVGCTLSVPCKGQAGIDLAKGKFFGKLENSHGHILVQVETKISSEPSIH